MMHTKNIYGQIVAVIFEAEDTLESIASVSRCNSNELVALMNRLHQEEWAGEPINWKETKRGGDE